jgi:hypothetical protein
LTRPAVTTFAVRTHSVTLECLERSRWRVSVDGRLLASFCSESRARAAGRAEARRLDFAESEQRGGRAGAAIASRK